jgi:hypothetical protein
MKLNKKAIVAAMFGVMAVSGIGCGTVATVIGSAAIGAECYAHRTEIAGAASKVASYVAAQMKNGIGSYAYDCYADPLGNVVIPGRLGSMMTAKADAELLNHYGVGTQTPAAPEVPATPAAPTTPAAPEVK